MSSGGLRAVADDHSDRQGGDDCLARSDIALQQAVHRLAAPQILPDTVNRPLLRKGQGIRQPGELLFQPFVLGREDLRRPLLPGPFLAQQAELEQEQLVESQPVAGSFQ